MTSNAAGNGTATDPSILSTPPGRSDFEAWRDEDGDPPALVVQVGAAQLRYQLRCIEDLHASRAWQKLEESPSSSVTLTFGVN